MSFRLKSFAEVTPKPSFPALEEETGRFWKERGLPRKVLDSGDESRPFIFFEGPPTANGRPGLHHVEARAVKDIIIRYRRLLGQKVIGARGGWDTHGLPVEIEVERQLGFSGKPDIEKYGIAKFNQACRDSVWRYMQEWERLTDRMAYSIDLADAYVTYKNEYIESGWWILKTLWQKGLLTRDYKVTMHCPRCGTSLSDHEVSQGFQDDVDDPSVWLRFRVKASGHELDSALAGSCLIAWTTTPWTLPANVALAVKPDANYALVEYTAPGADARTERLLLVEPLLGAILPEGSYRVIRTFVGRDLAGVRYENLFQGVPGADEALDLTSAYQVVADDFVSLEEGAGIVHIAPAYGDLEIGRKYGLPTLFSVDLAGETLPEFADQGFAGLFFKKADPLITRNLRERGLLFRSERVKHSYPFCWRCQTPLLYYAKPSWYIKTTARKEGLIRHNEEIHWAPDHIKTGRFGNWLANNIDWAISRERYWGTPLPLWVCDSCAKLDVVGSVAELAEKSKRPLDEMKQLDLHRPYVDEITWDCPDCQSDDKPDREKGTMRRVPDVADCWFDSGAMQVSQWHYPFENQAEFALAGQADFICEAIDQTRGWFYTLHALGTLLFDRPAFKNVICLGHILDSHGQKMSKSKGNIADPWQLMADYGADATRWFMYSSSPPYNPRRFSNDQVADIVRQLMLTIWNTYSFFVTYANLDGWTPEEGQVDPSKLQPIDRWALARLNALVRDVTAMLDDYDVHGPARAIESFVEDLSNWYVRRNRRRFWKAESDDDKKAAYSTLYTCLTTLSTLIAPFMPYLAEELYQNLVRGLEKDAPESIHLSQWPKVKEELIDEEMLGATALLLQTVSLARSARKNADLRIRQPLSELMIRAPKGVDQLRRFEPDLRDELNVKSVRFLGSGDTIVSYRFRPNLPVVGRKRGKLVPALRQRLVELEGDEAKRVARLVEEGQSVDLEIAGQMLTLSPDEFLVEATSPEGYAVAEDNGVLVALNTTLTPALILEGKARDIVRHIQEARKLAGLAISDRIAATLFEEPGVDGKPSDLATLLSAHGLEIAAETLATDLREARPEDSFYRTTVDLGGKSLVLGLRKVG